MPTPFPTLDPDTHALRMVDYFDTAEIVDMLPVSVTTVRRMVKAGRWPATHMAGRIYMSPEHLARVVELCTTDPDAIPDQSEQPTRLGTPVSDADLEGVR
jgi:hypothetical protein